MCVFMSIDSAGTEFWSPSKALQVLHESGCFDSEDGSKTFSWPENFQPFISEGLCSDLYGTVIYDSHPCTDDPLGLTATSDYELAVSALGACVWYLQRCFIDKDLLSMKSFEVCTFIIFYLEISLYC